MPDGAVVVALIWAAGALVLVVVQAFRAGIAQDRLRERIDKLSDLTNEALIELLCPTDTDSFGFSRHTRKREQILERVRVARLEREQCGSCGHAAFHHSIEHGCTIGDCPCNDRHPLWQGCE